jgi:hypothetical protein
MEESKATQNGDRQKKPMCYLAAGQEGHDPEELSGRDGFAEERWLYSPKLCPSAEEKQGEGSCGDGEIPGSDKRSMP